VNQDRLEKTLLGQVHTTSIQSTQKKIKNQTSKGACPVDGLISRLLSTIDVGKPVSAKARHRYNRMKTHLARKEELDRVDKLV